LDWAWSGTTKEHGGSNSGKCFNTSTTGHFFCDHLKIVLPLESCHKKINHNFENSDSTIAPFDTTMTIVNDPRQPQQRQQSLVHALSLLQRGPDQPDQPGSGNMPGLQPRARMSRDEERAYLLSKLEQVLVMMSGVDDDDDDDASVFVSLASVSPAPCSGEDNARAHHQDQ
jgi:hypothetical protein